MIFSEKFRTMGNAKLHNDIIREVCFPPLFIFPENSHYADWLSGTSSSLFAGLAFCSMISNMRAMVSRILK